MLDPLREKFIKDGAILHNWEFDASWSKKRKTIYEVMRVIDGSPLFIEEHIDRMLESARVSGIERHAMEVKSCVLQYLN